MDEELDFTLVRRERIYYFSKDLDQAKYQQNVGAQLDIEKEIQIQQCYLQLESTKH